MMLLTIKSIYIYIYNHVIVTSFVIFQAVSDLLIVCKGAVQSAENEQVKAKTLSAAKQTAETYLQILRHLGEVWIICSQG